MMKRELGFTYVEEYCWTKNAFPGALKGRFKNGFEPVYHFTKGDPSNITFNPVACGTPIKEESLKEHIENSRVLRRTVVRWEL